MDIPSIETRLACRMTMGRLTIIRGKLPLSNNAHKPCHEGIYCDLSDMKMGIAQIHECDCRNIPIEFGVALFHTASALSANRVQNNCDNIKQAIVFHLDGKKPPNLTLSCRHRPAVKILSAGFLIPTVCIISPRLSVHVQQDKNVDRQIPSRLELVRGCSDPVVIHSLVNPMLP